MSETIRHHTLPRMVLVKPLHEGFSFYLCEITARFCNVAFPRSFEKISLFTSHIPVYITPLFLSLLIGQDVKEWGGQ